MVSKSILKSLVMVGVLLTSLYAGELKVVNNATTAIKVTVRAKENQTSGKPFEVTNVVDPGKAINVTLDEKEFKGTTFSIKGVVVIPTSTVVPPSAVVLEESNECLLTGCEGGEVIFVNTPDGRIVCSVTGAR